jgi:hypothetical protein
MSTATLSPGLPGVVAGTRPPAVELSRAPSSLTPVKQAFRSIWFAALLAAICLEGLGRRYLPAVPSAGFYFLKDVVLLIGLIRFRINPDVKRTFTSLYGGYLPFLKLGILWTVAEIINPDQKSLVLGVLGVRAYWFWWLAPLVIASVLLDPMVRRKVILLQSAVTMIVALLAMLQFGAPADDDLNTYSVVDGEKSLGIEIASTGRARVSSTFSFISGFSDFAVLVPVLLLCLGLGEHDKKARFAALIAMLFAAAALPMSGSRGPFLLTLALCAMVAWRTGLVLTKVGRRIIVVAVAAGFISVFAFPDALQGVMDRFEGEDTGDRMVEFLTVLPPVALLRNQDYAPLGDGTGMMQNYRGQLGVHEDIHTAEGEVGRYLVELGPVGYLLVWLAKLGLVMVLWRSAKILKKAGRRAASACALAYALLGLYGSLVFDHIYSALFFVGFGFILQEVVQAQTQLKALARSHHREKALLATRNGTAGLLPAPASASG